MSETTVNVRYMIEDVAAAAEFYRRHLGFSIETNAAPAFVSITRGTLRLLLSGPGSSGARALPDGRKPMPGGWNRIQILVDDLAAEAARLTDAGVPFRSGIVSGPGGAQIVMDDPSGNPIELFQPGAR